MRPWSFDRFLTWLGSLAARIGWRTALLEPLAWRRSASCSSLPAARLPSSAPGSTMRVAASAAMPCAVLGGQGRSLLHMRFHSSGPACVASRVEPAMRLQQVNLQGMKQAQLRGEVPAGADLPADASIMRTTSVRRGAAQPVACDGAQLRVSDPQRPGRTSALGRAVRRRGRHPDFSPERNRPCLTTWC